MENSGRYSQSWVWKIPGITEIKVISTFAKGKGKNLESGIYAQGSHRVLPVKTCFLHQPILDKAVEAVRRAVSDCKYQPYDEDRRTGLIRHVLVRHSLTTDEVMAVLVTASPVLPGAKAFVKKVRELCPNITTIVQNVNARSTSAVLGDREKILYGKGFITDSLCGVRFRIAASSFYQVNPKQTEILYKKAIEAAGLNGKQTVLDAYCGVGTIGLTAAKHAKNVLGVELNKSAVQCAIENAKANHLKNARFLCGDATRFYTENGGKSRAGERSIYGSAQSRQHPGIFAGCKPNEAGKAGVYFL
ncbi:23S rRNA (uracil(1939)-C(5))-methyltransferase RlmD [Blautia argi]|uniref:23S rRNA (uracil(1939)-C(5))-methyltransferase RlmD n=1 Tax=Blautia argi TaxID=1912897 RepID=UPI0026AB5956|nr:23S rRNA (uracil(1939)-C(5))-methyltransferase RlmD [Blautia argi]